MTPATENDYNLKLQTVLEVTEKYTEGLKFGFFRKYDD